MALKLRRSPSVKFSASRPEVELGERKHRGKNSAPYQSDYIFAKGKMPFVAGLRWQPQEGSQTVALQQALASGDRSYCLTSDGSMIGFFQSGARPPGATRGAAVSIVLALIEFHSQGGDEIFVFRVDAKRSCFVALRGGQPVPGFDVIGLTEDVMLRLSEYLELPHLENVRRVGSSDLLGANAEVIDWNGLVECVEPAIRLRNIPDLKRLGLGFVLVMLIAGGIGWAVMDRMERVRRATEEALRLQRDPNHMYDDRINDALRRVQGSGNSGLRRAVGGVKHIPLNVAGWSLTRVECSPALCTASWRRVYGSFADFMAALPHSAIGKPEYDPQSGTGLQDAQIVTRHRTYSDDAPHQGEPVSSSAAPVLLRRESLPSQAQVLTQFLSDLQDVTLAHVSVSAARAALFGADGLESADASALLRPVVAGDWTAKGPLWTLDDMKISDYVALDRLTIEMSSSTSQKDGDPKTISTYQLSGKYYAKGKDF